MAYILINGKTVHAGGAVIPISDRGFRYGDGLFETIAVYCGVPYRLDWHLDRLRRGLSALRIDYPADRLQQDCMTLLRQNQIIEGLLRIQITRGGGRGYLPNADGTPTCVIETMPAPDRPQQSVRLWMSSYRRVSPQSLPARYKSCQGLNSTLARMEAHDHDCFDALMLDHDGQLCETSSGNIFWLRENTLYTPALDGGAVEGATRAAMMELSPYAVKEVRIDINALQHAEAVFITNVAWKVLPVAELQPDGMRWDSADAAGWLNRLLMQDIEKYCQSLFRAS